MIQHKIYFCFTFFEKSRLKIVMTRCTCTYSFIKSYFLKLNVNRKNSLEKINLRLFCPTVLFYKNRFYKNSKGQKSLDNFEFPDKGFFVTLFKKRSKFFILIISSIKNNYISKSFYMNSFHGGALLQTIVPVLSSIFCSYLGQ